MMTRHGQNISRGRMGFSLIEIMVAVTLLTVITVGLLAMFYHTQRAFRIGTSQVDVLESGRATMQLVTRELQEMSPTPSDLDFLPNFEATNSSLRIIQNLPVTGQRENLLQDVWFVSRRGDEWTATTYQVLEKNRGAGTLCRWVISTNVSSVLTNGGATTVHQWRALSNLVFNIRSLKVATTTNFNQPAPPYDRIADGVIHFRLKAYNEDGVIYAMTNSLFAIPEGYRFTNAVPAYVDVELAILEPKAVKQFERRTRSGIVQAKTYLEGQAYRTHLFKQRIPIRVRRSEYDLFAAQ